YRSTDQGFRSYLQSLARATLLRMVDAAGFLPTADLGAAWREVIAQMLGNSASVPQPTVSISVAASGSNNGDGVLLATVVGPEGIQRDYVFDETIRVDCTSDSQQGSVAGQEAFL